MAPKQNPSIGKAFRAMKAFGLSEDVVKPVLKNLLRVSDKNWEYIEDENYRVLVDAIFESEDEKAQKRKPNDDDDVPHEPEQPLKKLRPRHESQDLSFTEDGNATSSGTSLQGPNLNSDTAAADIDPRPLQAVIEPPMPPVCNVNPMDESEPDSPPTSLRLRDRRLTSSKALAMVEASETPQPWKTNEALHFSQMGLDDQSGVKVSIKHPNDEERTYSERSPQLMYSQDPEMESQITPWAVTETCTFIKPKDVPEVSEIPTGELAIAVFLPGAQSFSNEKDTEEGFVRVCNSANDAVKVTQPESETFNSFCNSDNGTNDAASLLYQDLAITAHTNGLHTSHHRIGGTTGNLIENVKEKEVLEEGTRKSVSINADKRNQTETVETTYLLDASDITKGEEKIKISIVNHFNDVPLPSFCYIHQSLVGHNAIVNVSLAQIAKEDCCPNCVGNCLSLKKPCICACTTEERCMYAPDGILNEEFLEESISMTQNPQKHRQFFCKHCSFEVGIDKDAVEPCQGHQVRKLVKECWLKCRCSKNCTNRRVQRGICYKLQVFMTSGGKGWGLRTLEDLPKGAFVCEFVGEILTLSELCLRHQSSLRNCAYSMILDACWASSKELKEDKDKALCLDASIYGNVARFINHRCMDANLVAVPVKVEASDQLYHRVAFFTSRKVAALEELTRDYGINFDYFDGLAKPFPCRCGSSFCRNIKHYNRKRVREAPKP